MSSPLWSLLRWQDLLPWVISAVSRFKRYNVRYRWEICVINFSPLQGAVSSTWCWTVSVRLVVLWAIMRTWRRAAAVSATLRVAAVQGLQQMIVRPAQPTAPSSIKVYAQRTAPLVLTMRLQLWSVKVSTWIHRFDLVLNTKYVEFSCYGFTVLQREFFLVFMMLLRQFKDHKFRCQND